jgi:hypothetical protein
MDAAPIVNAASTSPVAPDANLVPIPAGLFETVISAEVVDPAPVKGKWWRFWGKK